MQRESIESIKLSLAVSVSCEPKELEQHEESPAGHCQTTAARRTRPRQPQMTGSMSGGGGRNFGAQSVAMGEQRSVPLHKLNENRKPSEKSGEKSLHLLRGPQQQQQQQQQSQPSSCYLSQEVAVSKQEQEVSNKSTGPNRTAMPQAYENQYSLSSNQSSTRDQQTVDKHDQTQSCSNSIQEQMSPYWSDSTTLSNCDQQQLAVSSLESIKIDLISGEIEPSQANRPDTSNSQHLSQTSHSDDNNNNNDNSYPNERCQDGRQLSPRSSRRQDKQQGNNGGNNSSSSFVRQQQQLSAGSSKRKRHMANERERERTKSLNEALEILRNRLPVPEAEKRSKIQTLRTAKEYIEFLARLRASCVRQESNAECDSSSSAANQQQQLLAETQYFGPTTPNDLSQVGTIAHRRLNGLAPQLADSRNSHNNNNNEEPTNPLPDSPLTYKFYKFRHSKKLKRS